VAVLCILELESGILVMVCDDILVGELRFQLRDQTFGEGLFCSVLVIYEAVDAIDNVVDERCADTCDYYEALVTVERI
jgi:hypothetical protein